MGEGQIHAAKRSGVVPEAGWVLDSPEPKGDFSYYPKVTPRLPASPGGGKGVLCSPPSPADFEGVNLPHPRTTGKAYSSLR